MKDVVVKDSFTTTQHGAIVGKIQTTKVVLYNLDVIISVGYRVKSQIGTRFRQWANGIIKDYLLKGYAIHQRIINLEDRIDRQLSVHEKQIKVLQEQIDLYIKTNEEPKETLFGNGCVLDVWNYISDLVCSARRDIESTLVDRLSGTPDVRLTTVKDFSGIPENKLPIVDDLSGLPVDSSTVVDEHSTFLE